MATTAATPGIQRWMFHDVSINGESRKWGVYFMENHIKIYENGS